MKKLFLMMLCVASVVNIKGQEAGASIASKLAEKSVKMNLYGGVNVSSLVAVEDGHRSASKGRIGFEIGVGADVPINSGFYFQTGVFVVQKGLKEKGEANFNYANTELTVIGTPLYLDFPLLAAYQCSFARKVEVQACAGPFLACGLTGKLKVKDKNGQVLGTGQRSVDWFGSESDTNSAQFKRFDAGIHVGAGLKFVKKYYVGYAFEAGLANTSRNVNGIAMKTRCHMICLGIGL